MNPARRIEKEKGKEYDENLLENQFRLLRESATKTPQSFGTENPKPKNGRMAPIQKRSTGIKHPIVHSDVSTRVT